MRTPNSDHHFESDKPLHSSNRTRRRFISDALLMVAGATGFASLANKASAKAANWDNRFQLVVDFEINQPKGGRYHRPYVAVWIEDADTLSVRTLCLWVQKTEKGPRWIPDLKRWYRDEKERRVLSGGDLTKTISSATRRPGKYSLIWDGRDDEGKILPQGNYTLCIEAAREHGTYQIIKTPLTIGTSPFRKSLAGNIEIKAANVEYGRK